MTTAPSKALPHSPSMQMLTAALWGLTLFAAVYLLQGALHLPGLLYDPAAHGWLIDTTPTGVRMRYYSDLLGACVAGGATALLRYRWKARADDLTVLTGAALAVVALDLAWFFSRVLSALRN